MNQTSLLVSPIGVGTFHKPFPPRFSNGFNPNPTHSHQQGYLPDIDWLGDWFGDNPIQCQSPPPSNPSRSCFVRVHPIPPSEAYLAYNIRCIRSPYLTTVSRGQTPADNYTIDYYIYINRITKRITNFLSLFALEVGS